jgi:hypothetical protein
MAAEFKTVGKFEVLPLYFCLLAFQENEEYFKKNKKVSVSNF